MFLYHAIKAGHGHGDRQRGSIDRIRGDRELRTAIEDVLFDRNPEATDRLIELAEQSRGQTNEKASEDWREGTVEERITYALVRGDARYIEGDAEEARQASASTTRCDRRAADGGDERCRRPVWRR